MRFPAVNTHHGSLYNVSLQLLGDSRAGSGSLPTQGLPGARVFEEPVDVVEEGEVRV